MALTASGDWPVSRPQGAISLVAIDERSASFLPRRYNGEASALLPGTGGLDSRVQGEEVCLGRDVVNRRYDLAISVTCRRDHRPSRNEVHGPLYLDHASTVSWVLRAPSPGGGSYFPRLSAGFCIGRDLCNGHRHFFNEGRGFFHASGCTEHRRNLVDRRRQLLHALRCALQCGRLLTAPLRRSGWWRYLLVACAVCSELWSTACSPQPHSPPPSWTCR